MLLKQLAHYALSNHEILFLGDEFQVLHNPKFLHSPFFASVSHTLATYTELVCDPSFFIQESMRAIDL